MDFIFKYKMKVRDYELDAQKIVNNSNYQHYYEVARHEFFEHLGTSFTDISNKGVDLVLTSISIKYKRPLKGSDEFYCTVSSLEKEGIRYYYNQQIVRISDNTICSEARAEVVATSKGMPITPIVLDEIFKDYI
jgi:acyl-CoA thioester hydrolase